jgi:hypothetical protein
MVAFLSGAVLTAANLNSAFNALTIRTVTGTSDTLVLADAGGCVTYSNASATTSTIPPFSSIAYATGTKIVLVNLGAGVVTVTAGAGVTVNGATLTLAQNAGGTCIKTATNTWSFLPFSSGVGAANFSDTATGTYSGFKYLTFTASGTITITTAGFVDLVLSGAGGRGGTGIAPSGAGGGGGAGGSLVLLQYYLPAGTHTVTVGAGTGPSRLGPYVSPQGGNGGPNVRVGNWGGSGGGGGGGDTIAGGTALVGLGFDGGSTTGGSGGASGGGGASAVGAGSTNSVNGGAGGAGTTTSLFGTTLSGAYSAGNYAYGGGGGGGAYGAGTAGAAGATGGAAGSASGNGSDGSANTGGGGGGAYAASSGSTMYSGGNGGSGFVGIRVAV